MKKRQIDLELLEKKKRINYDEAEILFGVKKSTLKSWKENRKISFYKSIEGRQVLFEKKELEGMFTHVPSIDNIVNELEL